MSQILTIVSALVLGPSGIRSLIFWGFDSFTSFHMLSRLRLPGLVASISLHPINTFQTTTVIYILNTLFSPQELVDDEDDDFLKGEVPQSDTVTGLTPSSFDTHFRSPSSSVGSPPVLYIADQSPLLSRICD